MKRERIGDLLQFIIAVLAAVIVAIWADRHIGGRYKPSGNETRVQVDSVKTQVDTATKVAPEPSEIRHDTIYIRVPVSASKLPESVSELPESVSELPDSVPELPDSTIYIPLILEQKVYADPDSTYRAVVSGPAIDKYGPRLDSISVYSRKEIVYQTKTVYAEPSRWSIGFQAGYGASKEGLTPYIGIGIGIQYKIVNIGRNQK